MQDVIPPEFPVGPFNPLDDLNEAKRGELIFQIELAPQQLRNVVEHLSPAQLNTVYRNWTVRQITHHIADSHVNSYVRFKWALTENRPMIKDYDEGKWVALADSQTGGIAAPLALLEGLHIRWVQLLRSMSQEQFSHTFIHPATGKETALSTAIQYYAWHGQHHTGQISWLSRRHGWDATDREECR